MVTSDGKRMLSVDTRSNSVSVKPKEKVGKTGHVYEFQGILTGTKLNKWDFRAVISLLDRTTGREVKKNGTQELALDNKSHVVWIKNLEGHKEVYLNLNKIGELGKIQEVTNDGETFFVLNPWLAGNM